LVSKVKLITSILRFLSKLYYCGRDAYYKLATTFRPKHTILIFSLS